MSDRRGPRPFELDPTRVEVVVEPDANLPAGVEPEPELPPDAPQRGPRWWRWLGISGGVAIAAGLALDAVTFVQDLMAESPALGWPFAILLGIVGVTAIGALGRELNELRRLSRRASTRHAAERIAASALHGEAEKLLLPLASGFAARPAFAEGVRRYQEQASDSLDDRERLILFERTVLAPVDRGAYRLVLEASRDIGLLTALSPLGLLDGFLVLWRTLLMLRAIARLYGMAPGALASLALLRRCIRNAALAGLADVVTHAAVEHVGVSLLALLSARAGQGAGNALLAARLGVEAMRQSRPLPFLAEPLPTVRELRKALLETPVGKPPVLK
ncbi:MAG: TIGR01620 family protein [Geminicoccaceae bacterium]